MLLIASMTISGFIFWAAFMTDDVNDDDDTPGGGTLTPAYITTKQTLYSVLYKGQSFFVCQETNLREMK